jgi:membrane protease YdiL (CAAX protease family)
VGSQELTSSVYGSFAGIARSARLRYAWPEWLELFSVIGAIESVLWTEGRTRWILYLFANAWIIFAALRHRRSARELGVSSYGLRSCAWIIIAGAALALAVIALGAMHGTLHVLFGVMPIATHITLYVLWAVMQQFVAQSYFYLQIEKLTQSSNKAVVGAAVIFALLHIPNPVLSVVTFIGGLAFSEMFRRYRNIYPIAIAHALVALSIAVSLPDDVHRHMRVGIGYLHYHRSEKPSVPVAPPSEQASMHD